MKVETTVTLDLSGDPVTQTVTAKQGDIDSRLVRCTPVFAGENYLPEERVTIRLLYRNAHGDCTICDGQMEAGQVLVPLIPSLLAYAGTARCEVQFYSDGAVLTTGWFQVEVYPCLIRQEEAEENPAYESFTAALARADAAAETCLAAGATAQAQGDYAEMQAEYARQSGDSADEMAGYAREQGWQIAPDNREGLRVSFPAGQGDGWFLLRLSVHDPIMPLNMESNVAGGVKVIAQKLQAFLLTCKGLDDKPMADFLAK